MLDRASRYARQAGGYVRRRPRLTTVVSAVALAAVIGVSVGARTGSSPHAAASGRTHVSSADHHRQQAGGQHPAQHTAQQTRHQPPHARPHAEQQRPVPGTSAQPYRIYDSVTPSAIPAHHRVATYSNGMYAAKAADVAGRGPVLWIDTSATDPSASVLDVEPGDATPAAAAIWASHKLSHDPHAHACIYTMRSEWPTVRVAVHKLPDHMRSQVRWWIADPTGIPHVVPGASATQWYWGQHFDISTANPDF